MASALGRGAYRRWDRCDTGPAGYVNLRTSGVAAKLTPAVRGTSRLVSMQLSKSLVADAGLAVVLAAVATAATAAGAGVPQEQGDLPDATGLTLVAVAGLALVARRRFPLVTLAASTAITATYLLLGYPFGFIFLPFVVAVYTMARHRPLALSAPATVGALALLVSHLFVSSAGAQGLAYGSAWVAVPFGIGVTVRARQEVIARARADTIRARVDEERLRVAQEVHDIVGHGLAAIKMQADVALHVLAKRPDQARTALDAISRTSAQALEEVRATLAVVRDRAGDPVHAPAASLSRLDDLQRRMGEAGLDIRLTIEGEPRALPEEVSLAGYRIVQESLTNVLRHSTAKEAAVMIRYADDAVDVVVSNPVTGVPAESGGSGIAGMRQRALDVGGTFSAGLTGDDRFEVRARLPAGATR